jgi:hydroxymethylpyrimidine pyrophosphatase-like HAD family hydrolase
MPNPKIIACDFDGTLFTDNYPSVGEPIFETIERLKQEKAHGSKIILWTNRTDEALVNAVAACEAQDIFFDAINNNLPEIILWFKANPRKIFANEYWDDRMILLPHLRHPDAKEVKK